MSLALRRIAALTRKDLRSDARGKEILPTMALFALCLVFLFSFSLPPGSGRAAVPRPAAGAVGAREIAGTILWISLLFAGVLGFGRNASEEHEGSRMEGLLLAPVDPALLFAGKAAANFCFLSLLEVALLPAFMVLLDFGPSSLLPEFIVVAAAANAGLAATGALFGAASQLSRVRSLMVPLLSFPVVLPLLLGASRLTSMLLTTGDFGPEARWLGLMAVFDVIFVTIGAVLYEFVIQE